MRPILPKEISDTLPVSVLQHIYSFVPHTEKEKRTDPFLKKELQRIQLKKIKGESNMFMRDLDDFIIR